MLNRELKRVIAGVSMATLIVIIVFVALAVVLTTRYDIGTQTALANEGEQTPTPSPFWDTYPPIGCNTSGQDVTNEISTPSNNASYYLGQSVSFSCSRATDYDRRNANGAITYDSDAMASSGWPQWSCGFGSWQNGYVGTSVTWIAPSSAHANIAISVADNDLPKSIPQGDGGSRDDNPPRMVDSRAVNAVGVDKIKWDRGGYVDIYDDPIYVPKGTTISFKAIKNPDEYGVNWPAGKPEWGGSSGASGTGETKSVTFNTLSTSSADYKTVTAECGNTVSINVIVYEFSKIEYMRLGEGDDTYYKSDGGGVAGNVLFNSYFCYKVFFNPEISPTGILWEAWDTDWINERLNWGGGCLALQNFNTDTGKGHAKMVFFFDKNVDGDQDSGEVGIEKAFHVKELTNRSLTLARASTTSGPSDSTADSNLSNANFRIQTRDSTFDYRALCQFTRSGSVSTYQVDDDHPGLILSQEDVDKLLAAMSMGIIFVTRININNEELDGLAGGSWNKCFITHTSGGLVYAHELGHNAGCADRYEENSGYIMCHYMSACLYLEESEAGNYE